MTDLPTDEASIQRQREIREHWLGSETGAYDVVGMAREIDERYGTDRPIGEIPLAEFWRLADQCRVQQYDITTAVMHEGVFTTEQKVGLTETMLRREQEDVYACTPRGASICFCIVLRKI